MNANKLLAELIRDGGASLLEFIDLPADEITEGDRELELWRISARIESRLAMFRADLVSGRPDADRFDDRLGDAA